jgi:hypothetical protein
MHGWYAPSSIERHTIVGCVEASDIIIIAFGQDSMRGIRYCDVFLSGKMTCDYLRGVGFSHLAIYREQAMPLSAQ